MENQYTTSRNQYNDDEDAEDDDDNYDDDDDHDDDNDDDSACHINHGSKDSSTDHTQKYILKQNKCQTNQHATIAYELHGSTYFWMSLG
eukprot:10768628-Karenia_brevis.AAC.1